MRGTNRATIPAKKPAASTAALCLTPRSTRFAREPANRLEVRWGVGAKIKEQTKGLRQTVVNLDGQLGISKFFKNTVPPLWAKIQAFRQTPLGRVANFAFYLWLFLSGAFWTLLSFGLTAAFLINLLFPQFFAQRAQKMQEQARERFAQQQGGMPGGMPGGMGGMGGMGGPRAWAASAERRRGGWGAWAGPRPGDGQPRRAGRAQILRQRGGRGIRRGHRRGCQGRVGAASSVDG